MRQLKTMALAATVFISFMFTAVFANAADKYVIDTKGAHAFVQFRVKHLGFSWLWGRFNKFEGDFTYDPKDDTKNSAKVVIDLSSLDTNHAERDKHLSDKKYLNVKKYSKATFESTRFTSRGEGRASLTGNLTLMGVTKRVALDVEMIGAGDDPWGGYRQGFEARGTISPSDFGMKSDVGQVELFISVEGIRQKK